jgi:hypothetical protein
MPNIENLERKPFKDRHNNNFLNVNRKDILYREDIKTSFGYALVGITICLGTAGVVYVVGKKLIA